MKKIFADLSMRTNGFFKDTVKLCKNFDENFFDLLKDVHFYLYGKEYDASVLVLPFTETKFVDREKLENSLRISCSQNTSRQVLCFKHSLTFSQFFCRFIHFLEEFLKKEATRDVLVKKSLGFARLLQGILLLCPNFQKCCTFSGNTNDWTQICNIFNKTTLKFWRNWVKYCNYEIEVTAAKLLDKIEHKDMLRILAVRKLKKNAQLDAHILVCFRDGRR